MFPGREAALRRWIEQAATLVVMQRTRGRPGGDTPRWVPMRSARRCAATHPSRAASAAKGAERGQRTGRRRQIRPRMAMPPRCDTCGGPGNRFALRRAAPAISSAARRFAPCTPAPTWQLRNNRHAVATACRYGRGDITANAIEGSFDNRQLVSPFNALAFAAHATAARRRRRLVLRRGRRRARFLSPLWDRGAPPLLLAGRPRSCSSSGAPVPLRPLLADASARARRSIGEQGAPHGRIHRRRR